MLLPIDDVLGKDEVAAFRRRLEAAAWADGRITAGHQSARAKHNAQLPGDAPEAVELGRIVVQRLARHPAFITAALPHRVFPPLFNRYDVGMTFGAHIDNAIRALDDPRSPYERVRTDVSATLFLSEPSEYDGGELTIEDHYGTHAVKLGAGSLVLYPGTSVHRVEPVTRGTRFASFFWIQSMVRSAMQRRLLLDLDLSIQALRRRDPNAPELLQLSGVYHNLLREWAEV